MPDEPELSAADLHKLASELKTIREELEDRMFDRSAEVNLRMTRIIAASRIVAGFIQAQGLDPEADMRYYTQRAVYWVAAIEDMIEQELGDD